MHIKITVGTCFTEMVADTGSVNRDGMRKLLDALNAAAQQPGSSRILVEVVSPERKLTFGDHVEIWNYALGKTLHHAKIAYVITGRASNRDIGFAENFSNNRGLRLKFFVSRHEALSWLLADSRDCAGAPASDTGFRPEARGLHLPAPGLSARQQACEPA